MEITTLYAKRVPTIDPMYLKYSTERSEKKFDVLLYSDKECTKIKCRIQWDEKDIPQKSNKVVTIDEYRYLVKFI